MGAKSSVNSESTLISDFGFRLQIDFRIQIDGMLLAGDIGGTKTLLGLFERARGAAAAAASCARSARSTIADLPSMIAEFLDGDEAADARSAIESACFGVAGPVIDDSGQAHQRAVARRRARRSPPRFAIARVSLLNDLEAMAYAVPVLRRLGSRTCCRRARRCAAATSR